MSVSLTRWRRAPSAVMSRPTAKARPKQDYSSAISFCGMLRRAARQDEARHQHLHRLAILIERGRPHLDQPLLGARPRWTHLDDLALDAQLIARAHRVRPAEFIEARADDAAGGLELTLDQEPHGER